MVNRNGIKGSRWESAIVGFLRDHGFPHAERRAKAGINDKGDITGVTPHLVIEAKDQAKIDLPGFLREAEEEAANANAILPVAWVKARGKGVDKSYVVMYPGTFILLLKEWLHREDSR